MQAGAYVLKFISGKYQGGEFPLELDTEIEIGRGSELDMVLVEDMVSRRHARITSYGGELAIEDFGSTNGTFVNGEKITKARIKEGDRILIGTNIIKLVHRGRMVEDSGVGMVPEASRMPSAANGQGGKVTRATGATLTGSISGLIEEVPLPDLLQLFSTSRKSGVLVILADETGKIYLRQGRVYYATINDEAELDPYKAFYRLIAWRQGTFSLEQPTEEAFGNEMDEGVESLMMEGMRQLDEMLNLGPDVPEMQNVLRVKMPLVASLRNLSPEHLDVFQLILNHETVSRVLNNSLTSDLDTLQDLVHLIRNDYVSVE